MKLNLPYDIHPDFQFNVNEIKVAPLFIQSFAAIYTQIESFSYKSSPEAQELARKTAIETLQSIFNELKKKANDSAYVDFLIELEEKCLRLLNDDLKYFFERQEIRPVKSNKGNLEALNSKRFFVGELSKDCLHGLLEIVAKELEGLRKNAINGNLTRDDLSINNGPVVRRILRKLNKEFNNNGVNKIVSKYANKKMSVGGVALELSVSSAKWWKNFYSTTRAPLTLYAHTDESLDYPKAIIYLSDVHDSNGITSVYPEFVEKLELTPIQKIVGRVIGSVGANPESPLYNLYNKNYHQGFSSEVFRKHFSMLPKEMRYNSHFGWDVLPDSDLEKNLVATEVKVKGPAGTFLVFDGAKLLHRGGLVEAGERVALQVIFTKKRSLCAKVLDKMRRVLKVNK